MRSVYILFIGLGIVLAGALLVHFDIIIIEWGYFALLIGLVVMLLAQFRIKYDKL